MFFLAGVFYYISSAAEEGGLNGWNFTNHQIACIKQDLFLLENQLPFHVLRLLFRDADFRWKIW